MYLTRRETIERVRECEWHVFIYYHLQDKTYCLIIPWASPLYAFWVMFASGNCLAISSTKEVATCVRCPSHPIQLLMLSNASPRCATTNGCDNKLERQGGNNIQLLNPPTLSFHYLCSSFEIGRASCRERVL